MTVSVKTIRDISVGVYDGPHATPELYDEGAAVFLGIPNLRADGQIDVTAARWVAERDLAKWTRRVTPQANDIVFTYEATLNRYAIIPEGFICCLGRRTALVRPDPSQIDHRYLFYYFFSPRWRAQIDANTLTGATVDRIPLTTFPDFEVFVPDIRVQRQIAEILSAYDDLVAINQHRIALLEDAARSLYREWFVHLRFPGYEQVEVNEGWPTGWGVHSLSSVAEVNARSIGTKGRPDSILYIDISSVTPGLIDSVTPYIFADAPGRARRRVIHGDVIWSCVRPNRRSYALIWEPDERLVASTGFAVISATKVPFSYLYITTTEDNFVGYLEQNATGAAYPAVTAKTFEEAKIVVPDPDTLASFEVIVLPMLEQMEALKLQNRNLTYARNILLPKLMAGELDVSGIPLPGELTA